MAKKKTKAVNNPARGFATISVASKTRVESTEDAAAAEASLENTVLATPAVQERKPDDATAIAPLANGGDTKHLTPEELERELEHNELQLLVEKYGARMRRDVQRQISRSQTDLRTLRGQAQNINVLPWIDDALLNDMLTLARSDAAEDDVAVSLSDNRKKLPVGEELVVRCWTLSRTLSAMGVDQDKINHILRQILRRHPEEVDVGAVWGLEDAFETLALDDTMELPTYDTITDMHVGGDKQISPLEEKDRPPDNTDSHPQGSSAKSTPPASTNGVHREVESITVHAPEDDFHVSDLDSDLEPDELLSSYLATKVQLLERRPQLVIASRGKSSKGTVPSSKAALIDPSPGVRKLQSKLKLIESDPIFDQDLADSQWMERYHEIAQQNALKHLPVERQDSPSQSATAVIRSSHSQSNLKDDDLEESDQLFNPDMFLVPDEPTSADTKLGQNKPEHILHRDFGKLTGIHPRRILEDACRGRDSLVKLTYKRVSHNNYRCRHSLNISWAKDQQLLTRTWPPTVSLKQVRSPQGPHFVTSMVFVTIGVSTASVEQSEAYVSTAALFAIFVSSPTDGRVNLRLPSAWKEVWSEFERWRQQQIDASDREEVKAIQRLVEDQSRKEEEDGVILPSAFRPKSRTNTPSNFTATNRQYLPASPIPQTLVNIWTSRSSTAGYQKMLPQRLSLPIAGFRDAALEAIRTHQVLILCGETGCGKSTQLPAYILEDELSHGRECKIYCTQPRRISAVSLAQRVSEELGDRRGDVGTNRSLVGYSIRLENKVAAETRLVYATVGIVLRMLESSTALQHITHLIIDEVHERTIDTDFLLIVLRSLMVKRPELKVILMSATVDATRFSKYLQNAPILNVPGRTFPVQTFFLEDAVELLRYTTNNTRRTELEFDVDEVPTDGTPSPDFASALQGYSRGTRETLAQYDEYRVDFDLIAALVKRVLTDPDYAPFSHAVLVFLPGIGEIRELHELLTTEILPEQRCVVYPLHSSIASEEQQAAFQIPPRGTRKIVLATNIAETGITIPDVTCVIDTGKHKEMRFDERRQLSRLIMAFISKANAKQRRGRAGRVQEGICFHLFSRHRHDNMMSDQQAPEMLRLSLQDLVMRVKTCKLGDIEQTLAQALDPPSSRNVRRAIDALVEVGALTANQDLTTLGNQLAKLPLDANLGKLCLLAALFSCLDVGVTIAAIVSSKSPFVTPFNQRHAADLARLSFIRANSDLLTAYNAYASWRRVHQDPSQNTYAFCRKQFLSHQNLCAIEDLKGQLLSALSETGLLASHGQGKPMHTAQQRSKALRTLDPMDTNCDNESVVAGVIAWSFYPKILVRDGKGWKQTSNAQNVTLHLSSVNKTLTSVHTPANAAIRYLSYYNLMQSTSGNKAYNALSTTPVADMSLIVLAGRPDFRLSSGTIVVDGGRLRFKVADWRVAIALRFLRTNMECFVERRLDEPGADLNRRLVRWFEIWQRMFKVEVSSR